jgi:hypothetical protein
VCRPPYRGERGPQPGALRDVQDDEHAEHGVKRRAGDGRLEVAAQVKCESKL